MAKRNKAVVPGLKLSQKIFIIFALLLFLIINSWAFTVTTILDVQDSFAEVQTYAFPSIVLTSDLKDDVHIALIGVYNYVSTGDEAGKQTYNDRFTEALKKELELFELSQTSNDFVFTQNFNDKLLAITNSADQLIATYEADPNSPELVDRLNDLNGLRDDFNQFIEVEITNQLTQQIDTANESINSTAQLIWYYLIGVGAIIVLIIIVLILFISTNINKPLKRLTEAARRFAKGDFEPVKIKRGDELGLFAQTFNRMAKDIQSNQAALQEELEKTKELDRQKSEFLSVAAHQLRTPMAGIRWVNQMIFDEDLGKLSDEQKHHIGNGLENIDRMIKLINDLLDVTKIEEQKFNYNFEKVDLVEVAKEIVGELEEQALHNKVTVKFSGKSATTTVEADREKIKLALNNVIDNGIKYTKNGTLTIGFEAKKSAVVVTIKDSGIGIPEKSQEEMFNKFFRAPNAMKVFADGSGLGLYMVKDIITKHDGTINFESVEEKGTTFTISVPKKHVVTEEEKALEKARKAKEEADKKEKAKKATEEEKQRPEKEAEEQPEEPEEAPAEDEKDAKKAKKKKA